MLRFEDSIYLWLAMLIPFMTLLMLWKEMHRRKMLKRLGDLHLVDSLIPDASAKRRWLKFILLQIAVALLIVMIARPQMGTKVSHEKRNGIESIICLDISNSMMAEDVAPNRLQKSKMLIENLVDHFSNDKIGMIVFAGDAYVQLPITSDYVSAKMFLQSIEPSLIQTQGTDIAQALDLASNSFTQQKNIGKAIIVITDGEDHEGGAMEAAKAANAKGYKVFILGIGNTAGAPIPLHGGGYMTDNTGNTVMTALNEQMCRDIAAAGNGTYIHVDNTSTAQERLNSELAKMQKGDMESVVYSEYDEQFQAFGIIALIIIILEVCIGETINPWFSRFRFLTPKKKSAAAVMLLAAFISMSPEYAKAQGTDRSHIRSGNRLMRGNAQDGASKAEVEYRKAQAANAANPQALYNIGCALMAQQKDSLAMEMFDKASRIETSKQRRAMSYHNMGVIMQRQQQYGAAIDMYKKALRLKPDDHASRYNLVLCQRQNKQNKDNKGGGSDNKDNKDKDNKNKDKKDKDKKDNNQDKNKDQDKQKDNPQQQQQQPQQMSRENAEQLLNAAMQQEKATQQRMKDAMSKRQRRTLQKNW